MTDPTDPTPEAVDWWLLVRTPGELHVYQLGTLSDVDLTPAIWLHADQHEEARDWWTQPGSGYELALSVGEPHQKLLATATTVTRLPEPS